MRIAPAVPQHKINADSVPQVQAAFGGIIRPSKSSLHMDDMEHT